MHNYGWLWEGKIRSASAYQIASLASIARGMYSYSISFIIKHICFFSCQPQRDIILDACMHRAEPYLLKKNRSKTSGNQQGIEQSDRITTDRLANEPGQKGRAFRTIHLVWIAGIFILSGSSYLIYDLFLPRPVLDVQVVGIQNLSSAEVLRLSGLKTGRTWESSELTRVEELLELHPFIKTGTVQRERVADGERLILRIVERQCVAIVQNDREPGVLYEIDQELSILSENRLRCKDVPLMRGQFHKEMDRFDDPMLAQMLRNWMAMRTLYPELSDYVSEIRLRREGGLVFYLTGRQVRILVPNRLNQALIRKIYSTIAYIFKSDLQSGKAELRGDDVLIFSEGAR